MTAALKLLVGNHNARARACQLPATLTLEEWSKTVLDFGGLCAYCESESAAVLEHFVPLSKGGGTTAGNCLPACASCDDRKHSKHPSEALSSERYAALRRYLAIRSTGDDLGVPNIPPVLFIRNVPAALIAALDARVAELKAQDSLCAGLSRSTLALNILENAIKERKKK